MPAEFELPKAKLQEIIEKNTDWSKEKKKPRGLYLPAEFLELFQGLSTSETSKQNKTNIRSRYRKKINLTMRAISIELKNLSVKETQSQGEDFFGHQLYSLLIGYLECLEILDKIAARKGFGTKGNITSSEAGKKAHKLGRAHEFDSVEAEEAGKKGGVETLRKYGPEHMGIIGAYGGQNSRGGGKRDISLGIRKKKG